MKKRPQVSRTRVYFHVPMTSGFASRLRSKWQIKRPIGRNFIQIIIWISLCSMWQTILVSSSVPTVSSSVSTVSSNVSPVSSSVVENTSQWHLASHLDYARCDRNRDLSVAISFRLSSEFHCARCDILRAERRPLRSMWQGPNGTPPAPLEVTNSPCQFERSREHVF
jgi:hypothetical protein